MKVPLVEMFESFQGEGRFMGRRALFIRFAGCNLAHVCHLCDTKIEVKREVDIKEITERITRFLGDGGTLVVFTGGEPTLYSEALEKIVCPDVPLTWQVETNGIIKVPERIQEFVWITVSPKKYYHEDAILNYFDNPMADFKFVVGDVPESSTFWRYEEVEEVVKELMFEYRVPPWRIWLMPFGTTRKRLQQEAEKVWLIARDLGVNYSDRLHIRVFGRSMRGV